MKFTFKPSPNYRTSRSTSSIMRDLTMCLCAVTLFSVIYYCTAYGASYGLRVILLMADGIAATLITEAIWLKATKKDIKTGILSSYSWITAMILVLISSIDTGYFAIAVASVIAIVFGKLVFGGFGQNIFNPAAFGEAIIMQSFSATKSVDFATSATPTNVLNSYGWVLNSEQFSSVSSQFGGLGNMFLGMYPSCIGSTCGLLIIACGIFLIVRKDIDWQTPVFYIGSIFVMTALIGAMHGSGFWYPAIQILSGGILFGAIFMITDPVTSPVTLPGRVVFAVGAAALTVIIRTKSNLADGVLYSILLMNMLTPAIDKMFDGNQIRDGKKFRNKTILTSVILLAVTLGFGSQLTAKTPASDTASTDNSGSTASAATTTSLSADYSQNEAECTEESNDGSTAVYACSAKGYGLINNVEGEGKNKVTVTVDLGTNTVKSVELKRFGDTEGVGSTATTDSALAAYEGKSISDDVDLTTGATYTSDSIASMVQAALNGGTPLASGETTGTSGGSSSTGSALALNGDYPDYEATCEESSNDGTTAVYACSAKGYGLINNIEGEGKNKVTVTVDLGTQSITSIELKRFGDTEGVGSMATTDSALGEYAGKTSADSVDAVSGATFTSTSIAAMAEAALNAAAGN